MKDESIDFSYFPYKRFSDIRIKNGEPLTYSTLNSHIIRLCSNLESLNITNTLQKAGYEQWGTVKKATESDITDVDGGVKTSVVTNDVLNRVLERLKDSNSNSFFSGKTLSISKNYEFAKGEFTVGTNENVAKKITNAPDLVMYTKIDIHPFGYDDKPFYTTSTSKTDKESYENVMESSGVINFEDVKKAKNYNEFHVYYHNSGYIICNNGNISKNHRQIMVSWIQIRAKT